MILLNGTNAAGGEISYGVGNTTNPISGQDYLFINHADIDYIASKHMNTIRLLFSWEVLQPTLNNPLATNTYANDLFERVEYITNIKNMYCMIEPHGASDTNFARYKGNVVGSSAVPNSAFADLWSRLATKYKDNPKVIFGLSNEPTSIGTMQWFSAAQAAINSIRAANFKNIIMCPGNGWTGSGSWLDNWYDIASPKVSNANAWLTLTDPMNNLIVSVHAYADDNAGGGTNNIMNENIFVERLTNVVNWARTNKIKVHMSEFGVSATNALAQATVNKVVNFIHANSDVLIGAFWWSTGPILWWSNYRFTLCPSNNYTTDSPQMVLLTNSGFLALPQSEAPPINITPTTTTVKAPGDQSYNSAKTYTIKTSTRTTYSDNSYVSIDVVLSNDHIDVDLAWDEMKIDLRGHKLNAFWNCTIEGTEGIVTVKPTAATKLVRAQNKTSIGFSFQRMADPTKAHYQVLIKSVKW